MNEFKLNEEQKIKSGFITPHNYFEDFTERIMQQLPKPDVKVVPLYRRKPVWFSAAAGFVLMASLGIFYTSTQQTINDQSLPDDDAVENYLMYQVNVNSYDLMQNLDQQDLDELEQNIAISDDAIEEYLATEDVYSLY